MATTVVFGNKICKLPGSYARVVSGVPRETPLASYNNFLLIDAGFGNGFNSLPGIVGNGKEKVFALTEEEANYYVKGGPLEPVVQGLFNPADGKAGISTLYLVKAAETTPASDSIGCIGSPLSLFGGTISATSIKTVEEGEICNTYPNNLTKESQLKKGFLLKCIYKNDVGKAWVEVWEGTYRGKNYGNADVGDTEANSAPILVFKSKKCSTPADLVAYLKNPASGFGVYLDAKDLAVTDAPGIVDSTNFGTTDISEIVKFSGGADAYIMSDDSSSSGAEESPAAVLTNILGFTIDSDYSCMMVAEPEGTNLLLPTALDHVTNDAKGIKMIIAAEADGADAKLLAVENNSDLLIVTANQGQNKSKVSATGFIDHDALVTAAKVAGRIFGLSPEIPGTLKSIGFEGMVTEPSDTELENYLDAGVITPYYDSDLGYFVLSQAVNSLQQNMELINDDCSTFSIQCKRILAQVVKNLVKQSKVDFWGSKGTEDKAANKTNLSEAYVKAWTETLLSKLSVAPNKTENNYLISYEVTKVEIIQDYINVYLAVTVNGEITKIFFLVTVLG